MTQHLLKQTYQTHLQELFIKMKYKYEIFSACLIGFLGLYAFQPSANSTRDDKITAIDGDTVFVPSQVIAPRLTSLEWHIRLKGVDTPELNGKCDKEKLLAREAKAYLDARLKNAYEITISRLVSHDKWGGRIVANLYVDGKDLSQELIDKGYAVPYNGGTKQSWCQ